MGFIVILPDIQIPCFWSYSLLLHFLLRSPSLSSSTSSLHFTFSFALTSVRQNPRDLLLFLCFILLNLPVQLQQPSSKQCHFALWFKNSLFFSYLLSCLILFHLILSPVLLPPPLPSPSIPLYNYPFTVDGHLGWSCTLTFMKNQ